MGRGTKELQHWKHLSMKIQEVTSNIVITEKYDNLCQNRDIWAPRGIFR